jgi:ribonuclease HI
MSSKPAITLYTDGGSHGNPGPGGYGVVLIADGARRELSGGYRLTTNNRMELMAAIVGLETLKKPSTITLFTDSKYLVDAINKDWVTRWQGSGWKRNKREKAANVDLWKRLLAAMQPHEVTFRWVKGHAGHKDNERADTLTNLAVKGKLGVDVVYERETNEADGQANLF